MQPDETLQQSSYGNMLDKETQKHISKSLFETLMIGLVIGIAAITGFTLNLKEAPLKFVFLAFFISAASGMSGFFIGFLFGIPKRNSIADSNTAYHLNNNLADISEWLTKIIIGLGLVEIKQIPAALLSVARFIQQQTGQENSVVIFSICTIVYFSLFGLYYGYNYMRLFLSRQLKQVDDNMVQVLDRKGAGLADKLSPQNLTGSDDLQTNLFKKGAATSEVNLTQTNLDSSTKQDLNDYNNLLRKAKTEDSYTFEDWYFKGVAAYNNGENNNAIAYMSNAIKINGMHANVPDAFIYISLAYYKLNLLDKAIETTENLIKNYPGYPQISQAYINNSIYYSTKGDLENSLIYINLAEQKTPTSEVVLSQKAYVLHLLNKSEEALKIYDLLISINANNAGYYYSEAIIYAENADRKNMYFNLQKSIGILPANKIYARRDNTFKNFWSENEFISLTE